MASAVVVQLPVALCQLALVWGGHVTSDRDPKSGRPVGAAEVTTKYCPVGGVTPWGSGQWRLTVDPAVTAVAEFANCSATGGVGLAALVPGVAITAEMVVSTPTPPTHRTRITEERERRVVPR